VCGAYAPVVISRASLLFSLASFSSALATSAALAEDPSKSVKLPPVTVDVGDQSQKAKQKAGKLKSKSNASIVDLQRWGINPTLARRRIARRSSWTTSTSRITGRPTAAFHRNVRRG
jgi:hypothetical protein